MQPTVCMTSKMATTTPAAATTPHEQMSVAMSPAPTPANASAAPKPKREKKPLPKPIYYPFWFGGSASSMAACVTHPLDLGEYCCPYFSPGPCPNP
jgi:hypothetical protein